LESEPLRRYGDRREIHVSVLAFDQLHGQRVTFISRKKLRVEPGARIDVFPGEQAVVSGRNTLELKAAGEKSINVTTTSPQLTSPQLEFWRYFNAR
jgi:hypothetical protein